MALREMAVPDPPKLYTTRYEKLGGVDYSTDITEIDRRRTPTGINMISDEGSYPVKRLGWRVINNLNSGKVIKMLVVDRHLSTADGTPDIIVVTENGVYGLRNDMPTTAEHEPEGYVSTELYRQASGIITDCALFTFNTEVFLIFQAGMYKVYSEGNFVFQSVFDDAYIPEVSIGTTANGTGATSLEAVNLIGTKRKIGFVGDDTNTTYYFYPENIRNGNEYKWMVKSSVVVEVNTVNGWTTLTEGTDYTLGSTSTVTGLDIQGNTSSTYIVVPTNITFTTTHPALVPEQDNIRITFEPFNGEVYSGTTYYGLFRKGGALADFLTAFTSAVYGHTKPDRVFVAGSAKRNVVYYSSVNQPTYFPDNNYLTIGHDDNEIVSLQRVSDYLAVIKGDSVLDNTIYLVRGSYLDESMYFMVIPTSATTGAISSKASASLIDEPLFLSRTGVFGIVSASTNTEKAIRNRSRYVDKKLTKEQGLKEACATVWNKYYILCVNNHCYILDGRNLTRSDKSDLNYQYEAYYWEGVPAVYMTTYLDELYFGTFDGRICKFNTDVIGSTKYCDNGVEVWEFMNDHWALTLTDRITQTVIIEGEEVEQEVVVASTIPCEWSTPYDDDGSPQYFKTLNKKGNLVTLLPLAKSSADVTIIKDGAKAFSLEKFYVDVFSWAKVLFDPFSFRSDISARDDFIKKKVKKYKRLQIIVSNDGMFEPFGILGITKTYSVGNFSK